MYTFVVETQTVQSAVKVQRKLKEKEKKEQN